GPSPLDPVSPWAQAALTLAAEALASTVSTASGGVAVTLTREAGASVRVEKTVTIRDATPEVRYRLGTPAGMTGVSGRWAVQFDVALTAGDAPARCLTARGQPSLGSTGRERGTALRAAGSTRASVAGHHRRDGGIGGGGRSPSGLLPGAA